MQLPLASFDPCSNSQRKPPCLLVCKLLGMFCVESRRQWDFLARLKQMLFLIYNTMMTDI